MRWGWTVGCAALALLYTWGAVFPATPDPRWQRPYQSVSAPTELSREHSALWAATFAAGAVIAYRRRRKD
jgi:hypothetical protein